MIVLQNDCCSIFMQINLYQYFLCLSPQVVWLKNGREVKMGKKYEYLIIDRKRILIVHNVTEEDVGIYECTLGDDRTSVQLSLKGMLRKVLILILIIILRLNFIAEQTQ